jgi:xanthine phosphoribosyltransferase
MTIIVKAEAEAEAEDSFERVKVFTWENIDQMAELLAQAIAQRVKRTLPDCSIAAVTRGGLIPAAMLSHKLGIPITQFIVINSLPLSHQNMLDKLIIVDDIVDTGKTFSRIRQIYLNALRVSLITKPEGKAHRHISVMEVPQGTWVQWPWEREGKEWTRSS